MNVGTLTISLTARTAALLSSLSKVRVFESGVMASVQRMNRSIGTLGQSLSVLSLPLVAIGGLAVKKFADFEYSMAKVVGLAGIASTQVQAWTKDVMHLSQKTGESAQELAEALYFVSSSGIHGSKVLEVLEVSAYGAMVGLGKTKDIANLLTSVMNAYGIANVNTAGTMDILVAAVREGKAEAVDMAKALGMVVNVAAELGISFANVASAVAATTRTGVPVTTSVTQLRQLLFSFLKERPMVESALESMGLTFEEVRKNLSEDLLTGLIKLRAVTSAWGDDALASVLPNVRAFNEALSLTGVNVLETMTLFKAIQNPTNAFATAIKSVADTAKVKLNQAFQTVNNSLISFGASIADDVIPIVEKFTNFISKLIGWFTSLDSGTQSIIITITALSAVLGPMLLVLSSFITAISAMASTLFTPLGAILAIAVAIMLVRDNMESWEKAWPRMTYQMAKFFLGAELKFLKFKDFMSELFVPQDEAKRKERTDRMDKVQSLIDEMQANLDSNPDLAYGFGDALGDSIKNEFNKVLALVGDFTKDLNSKLGGVKLNLGDTDTLLIEEILEYEMAMLDYADAIDAVRNAITKYGGVLKAFGDIPGITEANDINGIAIAVADQIQKVGKEISNVIANKGDLGEYMNSLPQGIKDIIEITDPGRLATINMYIETYTQSIKDADAALKDWAESNAIWESMGKPMMDYFKTLHEAQSKLSAMTTLSGGGNGTIMLEAQLEYWESIKQAAIEAASTMSQKGALIPQDVLNSYDEATKKIENLSVKIAAYGAIASGVVDIANSIGTAIGNAATGMENAWTGIVDSILAVAQQIIAAMLSVAVAALLADGATKGLLGLILAAVGIAVLTAMWTSQKSKMSTAANLASGGIVPSGYPNDTFSANLSSNEAVIPLERLPQLLGIGRGNRKQQVEFIIEGRVLKGILKDADTMGGIY